jgi:hypothetical protein
VCPTQGKEEAPMSLTMTIVMLIAGWLAVASAMLWGVLRIARRHHHPVDSTRITSQKSTATRLRTDRSVDINPERRCCDLLILKIKRSALGISKKAG